MKQKGQILTVSNFGYIFFNVMSYLRKTDFTFTLLCYPLGLATED